MEGGLSSGYEMVRKRWAGVDFSIRTVRCGGCPSSSRGDASRMPSRLPVGDTAGNDARLGFRLRPEATADRLHRLRRQSDFDFLVFLPRAARGGRVCWAAIGRADGTFHGAFLLCADAMEDRLSDEAEAEPALVGSCEITLS